MSFTAFATEELTVAGTAVGFTAATFGKATGAVIYVDTAPVRFTTDGTAPTSSLGTQVDPGYMILLANANQVNKFKAIRTTGTSATLHCEFGYDQPFFNIIPSTGSISPGTGATNLGKAEDAAHTTGDVGVMLLGVRETVPTDLSVGATDGDYEPLEVDSSGRLWVNPSGLSYDVATTITRPANTTAYTANDVLGGALDLGVLGPSAKAIEIISVQLEADITAIPSGMTNFTLYLYNVTPPSAVADNAAFDIPAGDRASFLGRIPLGAFTDEGSTLYLELNGISKQVVLAGTHLFGYLVTVGAFTPAGNSEVYKLTMHTRAV